MRKILMVAAALSIGGYATYRWQSSTPASTSAVEHDPKLIKDRLWVDHVPKNDRDKIHVFIALADKPRREGPRGPIGGFAHQSGWEGNFEAFRYESHGEEMRVLFPQNGDRETLTVKPSKCNEHGMDYCLDVSGSSRGVSRYYSRKGWDVRTVDDAEALVTQLAK